ncbi:MAG: AgmX/PglI C-terminal domain-containing protein [Bacteriovoracia bacterium]
MSLPSTASRAAMKETVEKKPSQPAEFDYATCTHFIVKIMRGAQAEAGGAQAPIRVWDSQMPLMLGHPVRWIAEKAPEGIRIRNIATPVGEAHDDAVVTLDVAQIKNAATVALPLSPQHWIQVKAYRHLPPAYRALSETAGRATDMKVFSCIGGWIKATDSLASEYQGSFQKTPSFTIQKQADGFQITSRHPGLKLKQGLDTKSENARTLENGIAIQLTASELLKSSLQIGPYRWFFNPLEAPADLRVIPNAEDRAEETAWFKKSMKVTGIAMGALTLILLLMPKPAVEVQQELIPAQYASIVLSKPQKAEAPAPTENTPEQATQAKNTAVVQAFRAKALQHAVSGLLKGGMTTLLAQSDFLGDARKASKLLDNVKNVAVDASKASEARSVQVASIGGTPGSKGVGYSKGQVAAVKGQGSAFVDLDIQGSNVQEGLTKDEVGKVIHAHLSEVRYCYESAMLHNPDIEGKLLIDFTIGGSGSVVSGAVKQSSLEDARLDDCILRRLTKWKFPTPKGGINVAVSYPFIFKSLGR